jgi:hypothetical protein
VATGHREFETLRQEAIEGAEPFEPRRRLWGDVVDELRWTWAGRKGWLLGMVGNLVFAVAYLAYTDYDPRAAGDIKAANVGLAVVLWCLADTVNTNQLGNDSQRVVNSLKAGDSVRRILAIKNLSLAILLFPIAILITVVHWLIAGRWHLLFHTAVFDLGAVFLWLGVGSVVSVLLPYPPIRIHRRVRAILARKGVVRYALAQAAPYVLWYVIIKALHLPWHAFYDNHVLGPRRAEFLAYALVYLGIAFAYWGLGLWVASVYDRRWGARLIRDLEREV